MECIKNWHDTVETVITVAIKLEKNKQNPLSALEALLLYGRNYAPRYSFRSNCQVKAVLHAQNATKICL